MWECCYYVFITKVKIMYVKPPNKIVDSIELAAEQIVYALDDW